MVKPRIARRFVKMVRVQVHHPVAGQRLNRQPQHFHRTLLAPKRGEVGPGLVEPILGDDHLLLPIPGDPQLGAEQPLPCLIQDIQVDVVPATVLLGREVMDAHCPPVRLAFFDIRLLDLHAIGCRVVARRFRSPPAPRRRSPPGETKPPPQ